MLDVVEGKDENRYLSQLHQNVDHTEKIPVFKSFFRPKKTFF